MRNERTILSKVITFSNIGVHTPKNGRRIGNSMRHSSYSLSLYAYLS